MAFLLPERRYGLWSPHDPDRCRSLLWGALKRWQHEGYPASVGQRLLLGLWTIGSPGRYPRGWRPFDGSVNQHEFSVRRLSTDLMRPIARGRLLPEGSGTKVDLSVAPGGWARWGLAASGYVFLLILGGLLTSAIQNGVLFAPGWSTVVVLCLLVGAIFGGPMLAHTVWHTRRAFAEDEPVLLGFLRSVLDLDQHTVDGPV